MFIHKDGSGKIVAAFANAQDMTQPGLVGLVQTEVADTDAALTAFINPQQPAIKAQLAALDAFIPRGLEDHWIASGFNTALLPAIQQQRLTQKQNLRAQLSALIKAGTP